jgi:hypothetical protein
MSSDDAAKALAEQARIFDLASKDPVDGVEEEQAVIDARKALKQITPAKIEAITQAVSATMRMEDGGGRRRTRSARSGRRRAKSRRRRYY